MSSFVHRYLALSLSPSLSCSIPFGLTSDYTPPNRFRPQHPDGVNASVHARGPTRPRTPCCMWYRQARVAIPPCTNRVFLTMTSRPKFQIPPCDPPPAWKRNAAASTNMSCVFAHACVSRRGRLFATASQASKPAQSGDHASNANRRESHSHAACQYNPH